MGGARVDYQLSPSLRLMGKGSGAQFDQPFGAPASNNSPAATNWTQERNNEWLGSLTQVLSNRSVNTARVGYASYGIDQESLTTWSHHWQSANGITNGGPNIRFRGFSFARNGNASIWSVA